jgi:hypothetical protein
MHPATVLAVEFPPAKGFKGARTNLADLARYKREGWLLPEHASTMARAIVSMNLCGGFPGTGSRCRRRMLRRMDEIARLRPTPASDRFHDERTEGYPRRAFRTNFHD